MAICNRRGGKRPGTGRPRNKVPSRRLTVPDVYWGLFRWLCSQEVETIDRLIEGQDATIALQKGNIALRVQLECEELRHRTLRENLVKIASKEFMSAQHEETRQAIRRLMKAAE